MIALYTGNIDGGRGRRFVDSHVSLYERLGLTRLLYEIAIVELRTLNRNRERAAVVVVCRSSVRGAREEDEVGPRLDQNKRCILIAEEGRSR